VWQIANQKRCDALLQSGGIREALESYRYMMDMSDEATKARCSVWSTGKFPAMSPGHSAHLHFAQLLNRLAGSIMMQKVFLTLPRAQILPLMQKTKIRKMLLSYTLQ